MNFLQIQVLNKHSWPVSVQTPWPDGEERLAKLCERLRVNGDKARKGFRDFIDDDGSRITDDLIELTSAIKVIPVTSADAERGFSTMNIICSSLRSRLGIERLSKLMFVSIVGPPLEDFNSSTYVNKWLASGHRGAFDNRSKRYERPQESRYSHIKKVFE
jgi:hypothetical protein